MRVLIGSISLLAILTVSFAAAREQRETPPRPKGKAAAKPLVFDTKGFFKDFDKNGDGSIQREELPPEYRSAFGRLDANKDDKISPTELTQGIAFLQPRRRPSDMVYMLIEMSDIDDDCHREVQRAYDILRLLDKNRDGQIDAAELKVGRERIVVNRADFLVKQLDADKDGRISREEAKGRIRENFQEIDGNGDDFIERAELLKAMTEKPAIAPAGGERRIAPSQPKNR